MPSELRIIRIDRLPIQNNWLQQVQQSLGHDETDHSMLRSTAQVNSNALRRLVLETNLAAVR